MLVGVPLSENLIVVVRFSRCCKQKLIALSITEEELIRLFERIAELRWTTELLKEIQVDINVRIAKYDSTMKESNILSRTSIKMYDPDANTEIVIKIFPPNHEI